MMDRRIRKSAAAELSKGRAAPAASGAEAQRRIEAVILAIPPGRVSSYGQVADLAGLPGRARLTARVLRVSDHVLPWFRVLRSNGHIAIDPLSEWHAEQVQRLRSEGVEVRESRVDLQRFGWHNAVADLLLRDLFGEMGELPEPAQRKASRRSR